MYLLEPITPRGLFMGFQIRKCHVAEHVHGTLALDGLVVLLCLNEKGTNVIESIPVHVLEMMRRARYNHHPSLAKQQVMCGDSVLGTLRQLK